MMPVKIISNLINSISPRPQRLPTPASSPPLPRHPAAPYFNCVYSPQINNYVTYNAKDYLIIPSRRLALATSLINLTMERKP